MLEVCAVMERLATRDRDEAVRTHATASLPEILLATTNVELAGSLVQLLTGHKIQVTNAEGSDLCALLEHQTGLRLLMLTDRDANGPDLDVVVAIKTQRPDLALLVLSSRPTIQLATESIRRGAEDFVPVPFSEDVLLKEVERILDAAELRERVEGLRRLVADTYGFDRIVSHSARMKPVFDRARAAARSATPVLIAGETGTGKELMARAIHANGPRASRPFVPINCAALPRDLVESELFGHRRGAFSGAFLDHPGLFVSAHGGTLFLDEIGDLPLEAQAKLLRVLQDGEIRAIGGLSSRKVDVRIIAATNCALAAIGSGRAMRQDLFFRLSVLVIELPPLRERADDIPLLAAFFLSRIRERQVAHVEGLDAEALEMLLAYPFPGNVRELENMLEGVSLTLSPKRSVIRTSDLRAWLSHRGQPIRAAAPSAMPLRLDELEAWAIQEALRQSGGNKREAARLLGISRDTLYRRLHDLGLDLRPSRVRP
jgi:DNA-binding NtrC family response regulator